MADDIFDYWYTWYPARFQKKTMHLDPYQDGLYRRLIDHYMITRAPLPDNDAALARICGVSPPDFTPHAAIIKAFFRVKKEVLFHPTCEGVLRDQEEANKIRREKASNAGKASQKKRKEKQGGNNNELNSGSTQAKLKSTKGHDRTVQERKGKEKDTQNTHSSATAAHDPAEPHPEPARVFSEFFEARPGRGGSSDGEDEARGDFDKLTDQGIATGEELIRAMRAYAAHCRAQEPPTAGTRFAKSAARFLRDGLWRQYANQPEVAAPSPQQPIPEWQAPLLRHISEAEVRSWFRDTALEGNRLIMRSKAAASMVRQRYDIQIAKAFGEGVEIVFGEGGAP